ncbi:aminotransferase class III-fold pyridoxal phosphate-dependent enzyme [Streptomyces sp. CB01881]|uniref:aspartate aminotransferase family protein n=1 Tax=Streptomyces sp. CB01881 TaxID=2078691 RepID=UPI000CDBCF99|nr:aminotransferase class III-fold pyridoxal phosphate-dependent enzyme [Streptomyces sp. CB01881]AUY52529.1 aspartate aminotransferase family protein [Streptomyces sp. CB01881]TYC70246.1 aspartate aminotransferase family protein [Streptomyces sp. CB01881]
MDLLDLIRDHQSSGRALLFRLMGATDPEVSGSGSWVTTGAGARYLDLGSFSVFLLGHSHPQVVEAVAEQLARLSGSTRTLPNELNARAAADLAEFAPPGLDKVMLLNSGAEAVEAAIKLARARTGRVPLAHLAGSFHGKTVGALSLTDAALFRDRLGPLLPDVIRLPRDDAGAAAELIRRHRPAAVFAEPVQGEGGVYPLTPGYATALREACDEAGTLLVFDEIQCGLGRCGSFWAHEDLGVRPDVLLSGKALGGGVIPVSAVIATEDAFQPYDRDPLLHTSTFGGNPLAAAALTATLKVLAAEDVPGLARSAGGRLREILEDLVRSWPRLFTEVTGRGALLGLHGTQPDVAGEMMRAALAENLLLTPCLTAPSILRLTPAAFIGAQDLAFVAEKLNAAARRTQLELD